MKLCLIPCLVSFAAFSSAQQTPIFGGNMPAMRPNFTAQDESNFNLALSYLQPGDMARVPAIEWEVLWDPKGEYNFKGIDAAIKKLAAKEVKQLWVLQPCPYPASPWYKNGWSDWWLPRRDLWPDIVKMNTKIVRHILDETKKYTSIKPLFQVWNEPEGGKPGGSVNTQFGEWKPEFHELLFKLVKDLRAQKIPKELLVGPAVSSFGESRRSETAEFMSMMPPKDLDWLSECGYRACHLRLSAPGAGGDPAKVKAGFRKSLDWYRWIDSKFTWPAGQKVILSELYVTPGDVGVKIDANMSQYHSIAFDLIADQPFAYVLPWGLRPGEQDAPDNAYLRYGGFGESMRKWRTKRGD